MNQQVEMTITVPAFVHEFFKTIGTKGTPEDRASNFMWMHVAKDVGDQIAGEGSNLNPETERRYVEVFNLMQQYFNHRAQTDPAMLAARKAQAGNETRN
jgi:hypothetical protein